MKLPEPTTMDLIRNYATACVCGGYAEVVRREALVIERIKYFERLGLFVDAVTAEINEQPLTEQQGKIRRAFDCAEPKTTAEVVAIVEKALS